MIINQFRGKYHFLSNFSNYGFYDEDLEHWKTVEHYYQAGKTNSIEWIKLIGNTVNASDAKQAGKKCPLRDNWEDVKIKRMWQGLKYKFGQNFSAKWKLLQTGDAVLIEGNTWHDNFWGNCRCLACSTINGKNILGKLLMKLRSEF